jgi:hypothetical protein
MNGEIGARFKSRLQVAESQLEDLYDYDERDAFKSEGRAKGAFRSKI